MSLSAYTTDNRSYYYIVQTGQPSDPVHVGQGPTIQDAIADLAPTPIQSVGPDCGERAGLEWTLAQEAGAPGYDDLYDADDELPEEEE